MYSSPLFVYRWIAAFALDFFILSYTREFRVSIFSSIFTSATRIFDHISLQTFTMQTPRVVLLESFEVYDTTTTSGSRESREHFYIEATINSDAPIMH